MKRQAKRKSWTQQQSVFWYRLMRVVFTLIFTFWIRRYRTFGTENVPSSGGIFLISNHTTGMDPFLLAFPIRSRMLRGPGKVELFENRFFGYIMRKIGMFPLVQGSANAAAVRTMVELYRNGRLVLVFPEGGRSATGELQSFNPDFARLIIRLRAPLLPAAVAGGKELLPIGSYLPKRSSPVVVGFGQPFDLSRFYDRPVTDELTTEAAAFMRERVADLLTKARTDQQALSA
jgi:1-acyl-sn-glycerol-3-phosphate acyltransferase